MSTAKTLHAAIVAATLVGALGFVLAQAQGSSTRSTVRAAEASLAEEADPGPSHGSAPAPTAERS